MGWNPKTQNLLQWTDISDALDKAVKYLDDTEREEPHVEIKHENPFALRMRMYKFVKAFTLQMKDNDVVDENKYAHLSIQATDDGVIITSSLERKPLVLTTDDGEEL
tara:strand:+ start:32 stop:352 length:321 start_codon:yes stop_codon:yes gene_type:complete